MSLAGKEVRIRRWSEQKEVMVCQFRAVERWAEQSVRLGEVGEPWDGRRVGVSSLRMQRLLLLMASARASPWDAAAAMSEVEEYQAGWRSTRLGGGY